MRPANIVTAIADILAGAAVASAFISSFQPLNLFWLIIATTGLYGGGVVFNDFFDADLDKIERPERPIPSGAATRKNAFILGALLFTLGISAAFQVTSVSGILACLITIFAVSYNAVTKHIELLGPLNMGLCRGLNLMLGVSLVPEIVFSYWFLMCIPIIFIAAITSISKGEVSGSGKQPLYIAACFYLLVFSAIVLLGASSKNYSWQNLPFALLFGVAVTPSIIRAIKDSSAEKIRAAVKAGILSLIIMNAALAAAFGGFLFGLIILLLLPFSKFLAKTFAVT